MASSQQEEGGEASCRPSPATAATAPSTVGLALCSNDCGFFGTPQTDNLCSFCYKKTLASTTAHMPASLAADDATETAGISHGFLTPPGSQDASKSGDGDGDGARPTCMEVRSVGASKSGDGSPTLIKLKSLGASKSGHGASTLVEVKSLDDTTTGQVDAKIMLPSKPDASGRCHTCRKRVALGCRFKCRCCVGDQYVFFCSLHRFPDQHSCTFDYKSAGREAISKGNPLVKADKLRHRI